MKAEQARNIADISLEKIRWEREEELDKLYEEFMGSGAYTYLISVITKSASIGGYSVSVDLKGKEFEGWKARDLRGILSRMGYGTFLSPQNHLDISWT